MPTTLEAAGLPPEEAIAFFRQKVGVTSRHWTDLWNEAHSHGFMVAGAASQALVEDFRAEVAKAIAHGTTLADFRLQFDAIVEKHGWEHNGTPAWRAQIIYETNLSMAYAAGRYAQMTEPATLAVFPYWQYQHNAAQRPRPQHLAWDGLTLRADDGWWNTHYPPNGWRCHCSVRVVSERMLARAGKSGPDRAPDIDLRPWKNPHTGEVVQVPHGIDPGFGYNPGRAWKQGIGKLPAAEVVIPPAPVDARRPSALAAYLRHPVGDAVLGDIPAPIARAIGAGRHEVRLSPDTLEKQRAHHPELTDADYIAAAKVLRAPALAVRDRARHVVLARRIGGVLYAVVKTTATGRANYLVSLRRTTPEAMLRIVRRGTVLAGSLEALREPDDSERADDDADGEDGAPVGPP